MPLDEQLRDALSPHVQQVWHNLQPHGVVDLTAEVRYLTAEKKFSVGVRARPQPQTASIEPVHFPYRLDRLEGVLLYRDGHVTFEHCKAEHGPVKIATEGYCDLTADGRWHVHFGNLSVDRLRADRELVQALPERLKRVAAALNPTGLMNLRGSLDLEHGGGPAEPSRWQWDLARGSPAGRPPLRRPVAGERLRRGLAAGPVRPGARAVPRRAGAGFAHLQGLPAYPGQGTDLDRRRPGAVRGVGGPARTGRRRPGPIRPALPAPSRPASSAERSTATAG